MEEKMGQRMSSLAPECNELKTKYDDCFNDWYSNKFLAGKSNQNECQELFDDYRECVHTALIKDGIIKKNLDEVREEAPFEKGGAPKDE